MKPVLREVSDPVSVVVSNVIEFRCVFKQKDKANIARK